MCAAKSRRRNERRRALKQESAFCGCRYRLRVASTMAGRQWGSPGGVRFGGCGGNAVAGSLVSIADPAQTKGRMALHALIEAAIEAHGGRSRWERVGAIEATLSARGRGREPRTFAASTAPSMVCSCRRGGACFRCSLAGVRYRFRRWWQSTCTSCARCRRRECLVLNEITGRYGSARKKCDGYRHHCCKSAAPRVAAVRNRKVFFREPT